VTTHSQPAPDPTRRALLVRSGLAGAGLAGLAATVTACGGGSPSAAAASGGSAGGPSGGSALGPARDVPVGGGKVFVSAQVVVTQPSAGEYKAFTAVCTHAQCIVDHDRLPVPRQQVQRQGRQRGDRPGLQPAGQQVHLGHRRPDLTDLSPPPKPVFSPGAVIDPNCPLLV
jgi:hypothetical protein